MFVTIVLGKPKINYLSRNLVKDEIRDLGILEEKLGNYQDAMKFLNRYLEMEPNAEDVDFILELIKEIREKINQL